MPKMPSIRVVKNYRGNPSNLIRTQRLTKYGFGASVFVPIRKLNIRRK
jgi:hypothetical protein